MNRITIEKSVGIDSPTMMQLFAERTVIQRAEISAAPPVVKREAQPRHIEIALENVLILSIEENAQVTELEPRETVVICFGKVKYEFVHNQSAVPGGAAASSETHRFEWDLSKRDDA